ncbi:uncharacterized protein J8A68_001304 [[Candida] subhashii]|uniref:Transcription factor tau 91 kDa subunit n=1 Tax=[Candida] subhashii TaxID=561895 RepID=A0A8J5QP25_9ASCO|nr:uncharacterized protein J8A68_001304 [[Candida] subhashii]KAG7665248.1 hypothetical protein J8A68_001304 [[Candida] subhashii]
MPPQQVYWKTGRDSSYRNRFKHYFGTDESYFELIKNYKTDWERFLFYVNEAKVKKYTTEDNFLNELPTIEESQLNLNELDLKSVDEGYFQSRFHNEIGLKIINGDGGELDLKLDENVTDLMEFAKRKAKIVSPGGQVTALKWLPNPLDDESGVSYLAIGVINNPKGISDSINNPELSMYSKSSNERGINSCIQIWKYDVKENEFSLENVLITTTMGAVSDLKWAPFHTTGNTLGVLVGAFTDGDVHLFKINKSLPSKYNIVNKSSYTYTSTYSTKRTKSDPNSNITCFDFLSIDKIIIGCVDGYISEFILPFHPHYSTDTNPTLPSYRTRFSDAPITSILAANYAPGEYLIVINSASTQCMAYDYTDPTQCFCSPLVSKSTTPPSYNHALRCFGVTPSHDATGYSFIRVPQETASGLLKASASVSCNVLGERLGHPLNLTGFANGDIVVLNFARRHLQGGKITSKVLVPLKLWKLELAEGTEAGEVKAGSFVLRAGYESCDVESPMTPSFMPPEVAISALGWNENVIGSSVYAAGTISGLLIVERLDPKGL